MSEVAKVPKEVDEAMPESVPETEVPDLNDSEPVEERMERIEHFMELEKSKLNRKIDQALFDTLVQLPPWVRALPALDSRSPLRDCLEKFGFEAEQAIPAPSGTVHLKRRREEVTQTEVKKVRLDAEETLKNMEKRSLPIPYPDEFAKMSAEEKQKYLGELSTMLSVFQTLSDDA